MNIGKIAQLAEKPEIYTPGTAVMWTDEYISKQLLQVHLNEEIDLASRKKSTIKTTVEWILNKTPKQTLTILDLGCGPGLYTELLAKKGHKITGVDFSKNSIEFARKRAEKNKHEIEYINANYLELELEENRFDLVMMIYTDFCVLNPEERKQLLFTIKKILKPGGIFIFDVNSDKEIEMKVSPKNWEAANIGFWKKEPYLALSESFIYPEEKVILYQHLVSDENENIDIYRFYTRFFSEKDLKNELIGSGFSTFSFHTDVLPADNLWSGEHVIFCVVHNSK